MGAALKLIDKEVFKNIESHTLGPLFDALVAHFPVAPIQSKEQLRRANMILSRLITLTQKPVFAKNEMEQINLYIQSIAKEVQVYETNQFGKTKTTGREMIEHLMALHGLRQIDLADELGGQSIVSSILKGKRELNKQQIQKLAHRFKVSVETFFDHD